MQRYEGKCSICERDLTEHSEAEYEYCVIKSVKRRAGIFTAAVDQF